MVVDPARLRKAQKPGKLSQFGGDAEMNWKNVPCETWYVDAAYPDGVRIFGLGELKTMGAGRARCGISSGGL